MNIGLGLRDKVLSWYNDAAAAAANYFELDKAEDIDRRIQSLEQHYDTLVFWRMQEIFDELPDELVPKDSKELDKLISNLGSMDPVQPIKFKAL